MGHLYIFLTIVFTVYGQLVIKWQMARVGSLPAGLAGKLWFLFGMVWNPWVFSGFCAAFLAALAWMAAMTRFELSYAYPFMGLAFVIVMVLSGLLFHEPITLPRLLGTGLVILGVIVVSQG